MTTDIRAIAKKTDPFASFALIIAAVTLIFAGTTAIIGNNVRDSILDCNTRFGQELIDSLTPRSESQTALERETKKYDDMSNHLDIVTLNVLTGKIKGDAALRRLTKAYAAKSAEYSKLQKARENVKSERVSNPYPTPPGPSCGKRTPK
jgi:hypothetical protein